MVFHLNVIGFAVVVVFHLELGFVVVYRSPRNLSLALYFKEKCDKNNLNQHRLAEMVVFLLESLLLKFGEHC
mgnify:CR=1 FL=1